MGYSLLVSPFSGPNSNLAKQLPSRITCWYPEPSELTCVLVYVRQVFASAVADSEPSRVASFARLRSLPRAIAIQLDVVLLLSGGFDGPLDCA